MRVHFPRLFPFALAYRARLDMSHPKRLSGNSLSIRVIPFGKGFFDGGSVSAHAQSVGGALFVLPIFVQPVVFFAGHGEIIEATVALVSHKG